MLEVPTMAIYILELVYKITLFSVHIFHCMLGLFRSCMWIRSMKYGSRLEFYREHG